MLKVQISVTHGRGLPTLCGFYNISIQGRKEAGAEGLLGGRQMEESVGSEGSQQHGYHVEGWVDSADSPLL